MDVTHLAYSDESHHLDGRFRSIGLITIELKNNDRVCSEVNEILVNSDVNEFMWKKLRSAKYRHAAIKLIDYTIKNIRSGLMRVDVLIWDSQDSRHKVFGRNDIENMKRMYHHLLKCVMKRRWPDGSIWKLMPDEQNLIDWQEQGQILNAHNLETVSLPPSLFNAEFITGIKKEYDVSEVSPLKSHEAPLIQLADLFAGLGVFSRECYDQYEVWLKVKGSQQDMYEAGNIEDHTVSEIERCQVLKHHDDSCKTAKLQVSLKSERGLITKDPKRPLNYWLYIPQRADDKAPVGL